MLLRYFVYFYDMEIIEEEAFLAWKEDITQEFPGKGKALFQVTISTAFNACTPFLLKDTLTFILSFPGLGEPVAHLAGDGRRGGV